MGDIVNPLADSLVARACIAADELEVEIRRLQKIHRKMETILRQKGPLSEAQRKSLNQLVIIVKLYQRIMEGDWECRDVDRTKPELKI